VGGLAPASKKEKDLGLSRAPILAGSVLGSV